MEALTDQEKLAHMEYNLSLVMHMGCCSPYLYERKDILIPRMIDQAEKEDMSVDDIVSRFVRGYHEMSVKQ